MSRLHYDINSAYVAYVIDQYNYGMDREISHNTWKYSTMDRLKDGWIEFSEKDVYIKIL